MTAAVGAPWPLADLVADHGKPTVTAVRDGMCWSWPGSDTRPPISIEVSRDDHPGRVIRVSNGRDRRVEVRLPDPDDNDLVRAMACVGLHR